MPWMIGFLMFYLSPIIKVIFNSAQTIKITDTGLETMFVGVDNFLNIFTLDPEFNEILITSIVTALSSLPFIVIFSLLMAVLLNMEFKGRGIARVIFILPLILGVDLIMTLGQVTDANELAGNMDVGNVGLQAKQLETLLLNSSIPESVSNLLITMVNGIFSIVSASGVQILIFLSALQSINPALYEVAKIEGANGYETFWKVTIPSIVPMIVMVVIYTLIDLFYRAPIAEKIYDAAFIEGNFGVSAAMSVTYLVIIFIILGIVMLLSKKAVVRNATY